MCSCPPHIAEAVTQTATHWPIIGSFLATIGAGVIGSHFGVMLMKWRYRWSRSRPTETA